MAKNTTADEQAVPSAEEQNQAQAQEQTPAAEPERKRRFTVSVLGEQNPTGAK